VAVAAGRGLGGGWGIVFCGTDAGGWRLRLEGRDGACVSENFFSIVFFSLSLGMAGRRGPVAGMLCRWEERAG